MEIVTSVQPRAMMLALAWRRKDVRSDVRATWGRLFIVVAAWVKAVLDVIRIEFP